jgi:hypothetical protein
MEPDIWMQVDSPLDWADVRQEYMQVNKTNLLSILISDKKNSVRLDVRSGRPPASLTGY